MASFDIQLGYDDPDEIRALYQALLRAEGEELSQLNRINTLRGTGYLALSDHNVAVATIEQERAQTRLTSVRILATAVRGEMRRLNIEPW